MMNEVLNSQTRASSLGGERYRVIIADDVHENCELLRKTIDPEGFDAFLVPSGEVAVDLASKVKPDLFLLDIRMPGIGGLEAARRLRAGEATSSVPIIFITVDDDIRSLVQAFEAGGVDYIVKPFKKEEVIARVKTHVELYRLRQALEQEIALRKHAEEESKSARAALTLADERLSFFTQQEAKRLGIQGFIGQSPALGKVVEQVRKVQQSDSISVVITGESGVGKELIARAIHFGSARSKGPFVPLNCSAIPKELAESLLFGHIKGSFSGAVKDQKGHFEMAEGGTLFLDELGELPLDLQAKLLRVLEDGVLMPVGASMPIKSNVRVISATHRSLPEEVAAGRFREDLYYRMTRFSILVPPLRERLEDIPSLAAHFLAQFASEMGRTTPKLAPEASDKLLEHDYPGNIRELKNVIERASIECNGEWVEATDILINHHEPQDVTSELPAFSKAAGELQVLSPEEKSIIKHVETHDTISNSQCRELIEVNIHRANYLLHKLTKSGHLQRAGSNRNSVYVKPQKA